ncbi:neuronal growth regulator 1-like isoform X2 [Halichondria panicea]|uniref:neuronal growth regulator 1-like isoform X2 n=1 Tax=Halichondria panicea TaxID=6063 RepID=UPI00312B6087
MVLTDGTNGVTIVNGTLVINDTDAFFLLGIPVSLQCGGGVDSIYLAGFFAPIVSFPNNGVVLEGGDIRLSCVSTTNRPGTFQFQWYNPAGEPFSTFQAPELTNVQRDQAGIYTCRLTSNHNEHFLEDSETLIVNSPSPPTVSGPTGQIFAGETTQLNCSSSVSNVLTLRWVRVGRLTLPSSATQVGNNLVFTNPLSTYTGTYSCTLTPGVSENITISFLTPSTEGVVNEVVIAVSVVGVIGVIVIILVFFVILLVYKRRKLSYSDDQTNPAYGMSVGQAPNDAVSIQSSEYEHNRDYKNIDPDNNNYNSEGKAVVVSNNAA